MELPRYFKPATVRDLLHSYRDRRRLESGVQEGMEVEANVCQGDDDLGIYFLWFHPIHLLKLFFDRKRIWRQGEEEGKS